MIYDVVIVGRGPAGLAAAIGARSRNKTTLVVGNPEGDNPLARSSLVDNYPGLPGVTGLELLEKLSDHAAKLGAEFLTGRVLSAMDLGDHYVLTVGSDLLEGRQLILATGLSRTGKFQGEEALLGRGVSYCATCDGMLYRNKAVVVIGLCSSAPEEANYLSQIGCQVTYIAKERPAALAEHIPYLPLQRLSIVGHNTVSGLMMEGGLVPAQGVFILRNSVAPNDLFPQLEIEDGYLKVDRAQQTNLPRLFAAGDCVGPPFQVAKAVGEGFTAGLFSCHEVDVPLPNSV